MRCPARAVAAAAAARPGGQGGQGKTNWRGSGERQHMQGCTEQTGMTRTCISKQHHAAQLTRNQQDGSTGTASCHGTARLSSDTHLAACMLQLGGVVLEQPQLLIQAGGLGGSFCWRCERSRLLAVKARVLLHVCCCMHRHQAAADSCLRRRVAPSKHKLSTPEDCESRVSRDAAEADALRARACRQAEGAQVGGQP